MADYFPRSITGHNSESHVADTWKILYPMIPKPKAWIGLNLYWPNFEIPAGHGLYLTSWHTEYMDVEWLRRQSERLYPRPMVCITDWPCDVTAVGPDNITCLTYDTFAQQFGILMERFGCATNIIMPKHKISSMSWRYTQYKKFITAYLVQRAADHDIVLSWHNRVSKPEDLHGHPIDIAYLNLDYSILDRSILINLPDEQDKINISPVLNGNWRNVGYIDALINCTNESIHYSFTTQFGCDWMWPGPYLTEKTMKPLLAGRPFVAIGQARTFDRLSALGFRSDFGFDTAYDQDIGDLTRIGKIFSLIDRILEQDIDILFDQSFAACQHNLHHISSRAIDDHAAYINQKTISEITNL